MPSKSQKQHNLMLAVSNDPALAEKVGIDQTVANEFLEKDAAEGLWQEGSLESFDETVLENEDELKELMPEASAEDSSDEDGFSQENHSEKPFRFEDRFAQSAE